MMLHVLDATLLREVLILFCLVAVRTQIRTSSLVRQCPRQHGLVSFAGVSTAWNSYVRCCVCQCNSLSTVVMSFVLIQVGEFCGASTVFDDFMKVTGMR